MPNGYPGDGSARQALGPTLQPGTQASDYTWDPESRNWILKDRPGYTYVNPKSSIALYGKGAGHSGWIPNDQYDSIYKGWTKAQIAALAAIGAAGAAGPIIGAFGSAGGGAGAAGASAAVPDIASTTVGLGSTLPGVAASTGFGAAGGAGMSFGVKDAVQLAPLVASLFGKGHVSSTPPQNDLMNQLIQMQLSNYQQSQPLRNAVLAMAKGLMPIAYQNGMSLPTGGR